MDHLIKTALAVRDGVHVALEGFLRLIQGDVWRLCLYMVGVPSVDHNVRGWVLGIARHTRLDPARRDAFVLTQLLGLSYEETAAVCGCPVGTVRSRVARARTDLQSLFDVHEAGTLPPPQATGTL